MLKVPHLPGKATGLSGTFTDKPAKDTDCMVFFPYSLFVITCRSNNHAWKLQLTVTDYVMQVFHSSRPCNLKP